MHIKMRDLLHEVDDKVKVRSLQLLLREMGLRKWRQLKRPEIKAHHAEARLRWAYAHEHFTNEDWQRVRWSDECIVERGVGKQPIWTFLRPSEQLVARDVQTVNGTTHGVKKMLWAAFGFDRRTGLVPLDGDPLARRGGISSWVIEQLYRSYLPTIMSDGDIFMHDGAGLYRGHIVVRLLQEMGITVMIWPPYSPDLNPIENLWAIMKKEIYKNHPELEHTLDTEETLIALVAAAQEAWHSIDEAILYNLAMTMPHRVAAVIKAEGWYTKY
jgi:transposase